MDIGILGCGWLGKPVGVYLRKHGYSVAGSTTRRENFVALSDLGIEPFLINLGDAESVNTAPGFFSAQIVMVSVPPRLGTVSKTEYLTQMERVRRGCVNGAARKVLFISSTSVYPDNYKTMTEEDANDDSVIKKAEDLFREERRLETTIIRFAGLVGPQRHPGRFLSGKVVNGATNPVNVIHQEDCVRIIHTLIERNNWGNVYNASADVHPTKEEFYTNAASVLGVPLPVFTAEAAPYKIISSERLKKDLAYSFVYPDPMLMQY